MLKLGIIGCGWLGSEIAEKAIDNGFEVIATARNAKEPNKGYSVLQYNLGDSFPSRHFKDCDYIVVSIPVNKNNTIQNFSKLFNELSWFKGTLIFTSSISVYFKEGHNDEDSKVDSENPNAQIESLIQRVFENVIILRLGGLIGKARHPIHYLAGREVKNGNHKVNLVHLDDILRVVFLLVGSNKKGGLYNVVHPNHPTKQDYYSNCAMRLNLALPQFEESENNGKVVLGTKLETEMKFKYLTEI